jgi:hypothetical protein
MLLIGKVGCPAMLVKALIDLILVHYASLRGLQSTPRSLNFCYQGWVLKKAATERPFTGRTYLIEVFFLQLF